MRRPSAAAAYATWMALLIAAYYLLPGCRPVSWGLLGLCGAGGIVAGVIVNRPAHKAPWLFLAGANLSFAIGQTSFLVLTQSLHQQVPFPSLLDGFYLATYPLCAAGLLIFIRCRTSGRDVRSLLDALTLTVGLGLLCWLYLILPYARSPGLTWEQRALAIAYPVGDVLVLAMLARLLAPGSLRTRPVQLLTLGTVGLLASGVAFGLIQLHGTFHPGTAADLGWALVYPAWGAAALHPTMTGLTQQAPGQQAATSPRLILLMLAALIAPAILLIQSTQGRPADASVIAVFSAILYLLVLSRLADTAASHRRALRRERVLRVAGVSLAAAGSVEEIAEAAQGAAATLIGPHRGRDALLTVRDGSALRTVGLVPGGPLAEAVQGWLPGLGASRPRLVPAAQLDIAAGRELAVGGSMLLCPIALGTLPRNSGTDAEQPAAADASPPGPGGDPLIGALAIFGPERTLAALSRTLEILAGQVALAVERAILSSEVSRRSSEDYFRTLVQDTSDVILITGDDGTIRYATPSAASLFGHVTVAGAELADLVRPGDREAIVASFTQMLERQQERPAGDWRITRPDGTTAEVQVRCSDLRQEPTVGGLVLTLRDVTKQRKLERELTHRVFHDALTGLPNRLLFSDRIGHALARARRTGTTVGVVLVDLDDFKVVNDSMGHGIGDELLVATASRLRMLARESDTAARLGGDEFALLLEEIGESAEVGRLAERVVRAFGEPFMLTVGAMIVTATVGVATTEDSGDAGDLVRHADLALYSAKAAGKRQWRRYRPLLSVGLAKRRELQEAIHDAVADSAFTLAYQPIVALTSGEIAGFEALVRWPHPRWGMLHPDQFIALAEETGHIVPLGAWVLKQAVTDTVRWQRQAKRGTALYVSVNVSARQFANPGFAASVEQALASCGLKPSALLLELTESVLLRRDERIWSELTELKRIGVRLAIDDFGTGYSSLGYLRELPIDVLKIDRSFVEGMAVSEQRLAIVEVVIRIAKTLGLTVMAEGIESEVQRDLLISLGCEYGQGYLLERPVAAAEAEALAQAGVVRPLRATSQ